MTALLSAGCDDSSNNNQQDLSVPGGDMAKAGADMTATADMTDTSGKGFILAADVVGTAFYEPAPDAGESAIPFAHTLASAVQLPEKAGSSDYSDFSFNLNTLKIGGCIANRYSIGTKNPTPDTQTAGVVAISGYNTKALVPVPTSTVAFAPPANIACINPVNPLPNYLCFYGTPGHSTGLDGQKVSSVVYPPIAKASYIGLCTANPGIGCSVADCQDLNLGAPYCEGKLFLNNGVISVAVAGQPSPGYGASVTTWGVGFNPDGGSGAIPQALTLTKITSGTTDVGGSAPVAFGNITALDPAADLTVEFSCDGSATRGSGCANGAGPFDLVVLNGSTSVNKRYQYSAGTLPNFGTLTCIEQRSKSAVDLGDEGGKFVIKSAALQAMVGTQTGGSVSLAAMQVKAVLGKGQTNLQAAGRGVFGFANLK